MTLLPDLVRQQGVCPFCGEFIDIPDDLEGMIECPNCNKKVVYEVRKIGYISVDTDKLPDEPLIRKNKDPLGIGRMISAELGQNVETRSVNAEVIKKHGKQWVKIL